MKTPLDDTARQTLRRTLADFEQVPPESVWYGVESALKRRKRIIIWRQLGVAAIFLLLVSLPVAYFVTRDSVPSTLEILVQQTGPDKSGNGSSTEIPRFAHKLSPSLTVASKPPAATDTSLINLHPVAIRSQINQTITTPAFAEPNITELVNEVAETSISEIARLDSTSTAGMPSPAGQGVPYPPESVQQPDGDFLALAIDLQKPVYDNRKWQLSLAYGTTKGLSPASDLLQASYDKGNFELDSYSSTVAVQTRNFSNIERTVHQQPLTFGILVSKGLTGRWAAETGLQYTLLSGASRTYEINRERREYNNHIHYLGIPVAIRFQLLSKRPFAIYFTQGLIIEKGLSLQYKNDRFFDQKLVQTEAGSQAIKGYQMSSLTSLGASFSFSKALGIYIQPGLQIFMRNASQPYNIRSSHAAWPSVNIGVRAQL